MEEIISNKQKRDKRNARRRKRRLEQHTGIDWIDPEEGYGNVRGERALWRAVILQMLEDATNHSRKPQDKFARMQARNWLEGNHRDFTMVCDLAGYDVTYARKQVKKALMHYRQWRKSEQTEALSKKSMVDTEIMTDTPKTHKQADILTFPTRIQQFA